MHKSIFHKTTTDKDTSRRAQMTAKKRNNVS